MQNKLHIKHASLLRVKWFCITCVHMEGVCGRRWEAVPKQWWEERGGIGGNWKVVRKHWWEERGGIGGNWKVVPKHWWEER